MARTIRRKVLRKKLVQPAPPTPEFCGEPSPEITPMERTELILKVLDGQNDLLKQHMANEETWQRGISKTLDEMNRHMGQLNGRTSKSERRLSVLSFIVLGMGGAFGLGVIMFFFRILPNIMQAVLSAHVTP